MPVTRERKAELVTELTEELKQAQAVIITDYRTLKVSDLQGIRNELRGMQTHYHVAKNTLLEIALKDAGLPVPANLLEGPTAVAFLRDDLSGPAKKLNAFFKEKELPIRGAIVGQTVYDAKGVEALGNLPGRNEMYASILGSLQGPASSLVGVLNGALSQLVYVLQAKAEQGEAQA
ncbi:MAG: 50S ribosomal protein L10 [Chloroflexota bacterium]|nr:MAG: 50S ribosomal protein L10 [Chloroflexota bacterium]